MDLRLREVTWIRLISLLVWTILMLLKRGISQLIDMIEKQVFVSSEQTSMGEEQDVEAEERTLMPPLNDSLCSTVFGHYFTGE